jgi:hypothetical protein
MEALDESATGSVTLSVLRRFGAEGEATWPLSPSRRALVDGEWAAPDCGRSGRIG